MANLRTAVADLRSGLTINLQDSASALDQAKAQLQARLATVQTAAQSLSTAVTTLPPGASGSVTSAQQDLSRQVQTTKSPSTRSAPRSRR